MDVRWKLSALTSCLHATAELARNETLVDKQLALALAGPAELMVAELAGQGLDAGEFFSHLIPLSALIENTQELARATLSKLVLSERALQLAPPLARLIQEALSVLRQARPDSLDELELRARPIHEQWESRGPGLLAALGKFADPQLLVDEAEVVLVHPVLGGGGHAHWPYNLVRLEAVLANPFPELPEVVRLGWLLAQLNLDLPHFQGNLSRQRLVEIGPLAILPVVLAAAEWAELARCEQATLARVGELWRLKPFDSSAVWAWWETYRATKPAFPIALAALDQMLG